MHTLPFLILTSNTVVGTNGYKGLQNLGNTCYMNSYLQCLFLTSKFREKIIDCSKLLDDDKNSNIYPLLFQLNRLFLFLSNKRASESYFTPIEMKCALPEPFNFSSQQQDSSEFGRILIEILEEQLRQLTKTVKKKIFFLSDEGGRQYFILLLIFFFNF